MGETTFIVGDTVDFIDDAKLADIGSGEALVTGHKLNRKGRRARRSRPDFPAVRVQIIDHGHAPAPGQPYPPAPDERSEKVIPTPRWWRNGSTIAVHRWPYGRSSATAAIPVTSSPDVTIPDLQRLIGLLGLDGTAARTAPRTGWATLVTHVEADADIDEDVLRATIGQALEDTQEAILASAAPRRPVVDPDGELVRVAMLLDSEPHEPGRYRHGVRCSILCLT